MVNHGDLVPSPAMAFGFFLPSSNIQPKHASPFLHNRASMSPLGAREASTLFAPDFFAAFKIGRSCDAFSMESKHTTPTTYALPNPSTVTADASSRSKPPRSVVHSTALPSELSLVTNRSVRSGSRLAPRARDSVAPTR